ncbi:hypothetical protein [Dyella lutea]|uniref:DUF5343 domain-containing protein n=1 Tax=Dyella lutea TaxID=2950441 RepID=A0ABT1F5M7_9GAMM|nr:hypothetical protein [Dyella lutea]MCP1372689.1 hypothetical protein [Dyella lutea]
MPKIVEYPRASLANSLELAEAVSSLGGSSTVPMAAERLNRKQGGAFTALISAATKYGLISSKGGRLTAQETFRNYKLAYNENEKKAALRTALLAPPMFAAVYRRFEGSVLPVEHFEKLLIREFDVPEDQASKVSSYFLEGLEQAGLIETGNKLIPLNDSDDLNADADPVADRETSEVLGQSGTSARPQPGQHKSNEFAVTFKGPGLDSTIVIVEEEDLEIVQVMLKKVRKALLSRSSDQ